MKKVVAILGILLVTTALTNAINITNDGKERAVYMDGIKIVPINKVITTNMEGNIKVSTSEDDDIMPTITKDPNGRILVTYATRHSFFDQDVTVVYSADGSTWTAATQFMSDEGILQYPSIIGIPEAGDVGLSFIDPLSEYPLWVLRSTDVTNPDTYIGLRVAWGDTEDYNEVAVGIVHYLLLTLFTNHNYYMWDIPGCPYLVYWTQELEQPPDIGGQYFDGQSILKTAPASNLNIATGQDYFYLLMEHFNETTGHSEIAFKKSVTDLDLLFTPGGGPGGMDKYADIEAMPWQMYLVKGDFDAKDPYAAASGSNVVVVYMSNDNVYGDWDIKCVYSHDGGETWETSEIATEHPVDEVYPAAFMSGNNVYCVYVKNGNLYLAKSEDGGETWSEPEQINEVDGTVVAEPRAIDISDGGIVWVDTRNGNSDIYYVPLPAPIITIGISGGFGVKATISNEGTEAAENLAWSVDLSGLVFIGKHAEGTIDTLNPGESVTVGPGLVFGIGPTTITVNAGGVTKTAKGFVLGPLVLGVS